MKGKKKRKEWSMKRKTKHRRKGRRRGRLIERDRLKQTNGEF